MKSLFAVFAMTLGFAFSYANAGTLSAADSRELISAFKTAQVTGQPNLEKGVIYNFDLACHLTDGMEKDPSTAEFGIYTYMCDVGAAKIYLAKAKVVFDAMTAVFGLKGNNPAVTGLNCTVDFENSNVDSRFACSYN